MPANGTPATSNRISNIIASCVDHHRHTRQPLGISGGFLFVPSLPLSTPPHGSVCYDETMNDRKALWVWVGIAVVAIAAVWGGVSWMLRSSAPKPAMIAPVHAPAGQVVAGFPQGLILGASASTSPASAGSASGSSGGSPGILAGITNSYSIHYSSSTNQYTAEWVSPSSTAALYAAYTAYVTKSGWTITKQADYPTLKEIFATQASASFGIIITPQAPSGNAGAKVIATYVGTAGQ